MVKESKREFERLKYTVCVTFIVGLPLFICECVYIYAYIQNKETICEYVKSTAPKYATDVSFTASRYTGSEIEISKARHTQRRERDRDKVN